MSESKGALELLIDALNRNTESNLALAAAGGAAPAGDASKSTGSKTTGSKTTSTKSTKAEDKKTGPKHTKAEATEVVVTVKEKLGVDKAKELLSNHGFKKVADLTEDKFDVIFDEGTAMLDEAGGDDENGGDDDI